MRGRTVMLALALGTALAACQPLYRNQGYAPTDGELAQLQLGVDTLDSVVAKVGRPMTGNVAGGPTLYYVQSRFRTLGFLEPREVEREVVALTFAPDGTLGAVERFGLERGRVVPLSRRTTDLVFADVGFIRQLIGNAGRLDAGQLFGDDDEG